MKTVEDHLNELNSLIEQAIQAYSKRISDISSQENYASILKEFNSSIALFGTETIHKIIISSSSNDFIVDDVTKKLKLATERFIKLNPQPN